MAMSMRMAAALADAFASDLFARPSQF